MTIPRNEIINVDCLEGLRSLPDDCVDCCVTSPPYWGLRDYGVKDQIGLEPTIAAYLARLTQVFHEVRRVLKPDGTLWMNMGDAYATSFYSHNSLRTVGQTNGEWSQLGQRGEKQQRPTPTAFPFKPKDLIGQPWRLAFALQADGWYLRSDIIWSKPNPMPESVTDRPTKAHEYVFLMSKNPRYFYDADAIREGSITDIESAASMTFGAKNGKYNTNEKAHSNDVGKKWKYTPTRNKRTVWTIATQPMPDAHFATFPEKLVEPCVLAGTSERGYCGECGRPWVRVVEIDGKSTYSKRKRLGYSPKRGSNERDRQSLDYAGGHGNNARNVETIGWEASCNCNADTVPGLVLDPFMGSGTTALVAHRLDRDFIGFELSREYCEIAQKRIGQEIAQGRLFI